MNVLSRYLLRQNLFYTGILLFSGVMVYLIVDLVERMGPMVEAGIGLGLVLQYFGFKIPLIVSQIMPAIFMLAVLLQVAVMHRNNELLALESNGISMKRPSVFFVSYALAVFALLFCFSETLGVQGEQITRDIWNQDVRDREDRSRHLRDLWFTEQEYVIHVQEVWPDEKRGKEITAYEKGGRDSIQAIIHAPEFEIDSHRWILPEAKVYRPHDMERQHTEGLELEIGTDLGLFTMSASRLPYEAWSFFTLNEMVTQLQASGSNVEEMATAMHGKVAYPFALVVMTLLALALFIWFKNIYALVTLGLVVIFLYYAVYVFGVGYAEEGMVPPLVGAWTANIFFGLLSLFQIFWMDRS